MEPALFDEQRLDWQIEAFRRGVSGESDSEEAIIQMEQTSLQLDYRGDEQLRFSRVDCDS